MKKLLSFFVIGTMLGSAMTVPCLSSFTAKVNNQQISNSVSGIIENASYDFNVETGHLTVKSVSGIPSKFISKLKEQYPSINQDLKSLDIRKTYDFIGTFAFCNCPNLVSVTVAPGIKIISESAFENCPALSIVKLPDGLEGIHKRAFFNAGLTEVLLPTTISMVFTQSFPESTRLIWIDSLKSIHTFRLKNNTLAWFVNYNDHEVKGSGILDYSVFLCENPDLF